MVVQQWQWTGPNGRNIALLDMHTMSQLWTYSNDSNQGLTAGICGSLPPLWDGAFQWPVMASNGFWAPGKIIADRISCLAICSAGKRRRGLGANGFVCFVFPAFVVTFTLLNIWRESDWRRNNIFFVRNIPLKRGYGGGGCAEIRFEGGCKME